MLPFILQQGKWKQKKIFPFNLKCTYLINRKQKWKNKNLTNISVSLCLTATETTQGSRYCPLRFATIVTNDVLLVLPVSWGHAGLPLSECSLAHRQHSSSSSCFRLLKFPMDFLSLEWWMCSMRQRKTNWFSLGG